MVSIEKYDVMGAGKTAQPTKYLSCKKGDMIQSPKVR